MKRVLIIACMLLALVGCSSSSVSNENTFVVGMECAYQPFNYQITSPSDTAVDLGSGMGYCDGYDVMIASDIAEALGKEVVIKKIAWDGLQPALDSGEIDAIIAGMTANESREAGIDFTTPYYESAGMVMIVRSDSIMADFTSINDFAGYNVIGQKNTNYDDVIDQIEGVNHITPKATYPELVVALQNGDADGITAEMPVAEGIVSANKGLAIVVFAEGQGFDVDTTVSIGLKEGTRGTETFEAIQTALDNISLETRNTYMANAVANAPVEE